MGRKRKLIQYLSSTPGAATGMVGTSYRKEGKFCRKSFSWHYLYGRTEEEAVNLLQEFIDIMEKSTTKIQLVKEDDYRSVPLQADADYDMTRVTLDMPKWVWRNLKGNLLEMNLESNTPRNRRYTDG